MCVYLGRAQSVAVGVGRNIEMFRPTRLLHGCYTLFMGADIHK